MRSCGGRTDGEYRGRGPMTAADTGFVCPLFRQIDGFFQASTYANFENFLMRSGFSSGITTGAKLTA